MNKQPRICAMFATVLLGLGISSTASALPEMEVGSHLVRVDAPANIQTPAADSTDAANIDDGDSAADVGVAQATSN